MADWVTRTLEEYKDKPEGKATFLRTLNEYSTLGRAGYMEKYPEVFDLSLYGGDWRSTPNSVYVNRAEAEINDLRGLLRQFSGPEATYIRWLINRQIQNKTAERERLSGRKYETRYEEAPMPDWMKDYLETSMPVGVTPPTTTGGRTRRGQQQDVSKLASTLRPMGAQAELTPEQMGQMAGYQAWGKSGSPYAYSEEAIMGMADWERWWQPHVRLSQELFPTKAKLGSKWMPASQR